MAHTHPQPVLGSSGRDLPELHIVEEIQGRFFPLDIPLTVLAMDDDGFAVESPVEFTPRTEYQFELSSARCPRSLVRAVDVHCLRVMTGGRPWYVAGFSYAPDIEGIVRERISALVRAGKGDPTLGETILPVSAPVSSPAPA
jgi:hypothetical protein